MKEKLKKTEVYKNWFYTGSPLVITKPAAREAGICLVHLLLGFLLSAARFSGSPLPLSLGLIVSAGGSPRGLAVLLGSSIGYLIMQPFSSGLMLASSSILCYVTMYIFGGIWVSRQRWFRSLVSGCMYLVVGTIFLMSQEFYLLLLCQFSLGVLLAALSPLSFDSLLSCRYQSLSAITAMGFLVMGTASIPSLLPFSPGLLAAAALSCAAVRLGDYGSAAPLSAACGIGLDLSMGTPGTHTFLFTTVALSGTAAKKQHPVFRTMLFLVAFLSCLALLDIITLDSLLSLGLGTGLSFLVPGVMVAGREPNAALEAAGQAAQQLSSGSNALTELYDALHIDPAEHRQQAQQQIISRVSRTVCSRCRNFSRCWSSQTPGAGQLFLKAIPTITARGKALREDFPKEFLEECRQSEGLLTALNQELDNAALRRRERHAAGEHRFVAARCLLHTSQLLSKNAELLCRTKRLPEEAFRVRVGVSARGRRGSRVSGDRGICFHGADRRFYVVLCDGVGTGSDAAKESLLTANALMELISSGMPPENAMELINGVFVLRNSGCYATMDVLELNLVTGQAQLFKWGAAPTYLKSGTNVNKYGTAGLPPSLGVGSTYGAEIIRLSLWGGDMLILASDGVMVDGSEGLIRSFEGNQVKELANLLIDHAEDMGGEDDMTAAVIRLDELRP